MNAILIKWSNNISFINELGSFKLFKEYSFNFAHVCYDTLIQVE